MVIRSMFPLVLLLTNLGFMNKLIEDMEKARNEKSTGSDLCRENGSSAASPFIKNPGKCIREPVR